MTQHWNKTLPRMTCRGCGELFDPRHGNARYCKASCRPSRTAASHTPSDGHCRACGAALEPKDGERKDTFLHRRFCNVQCSGAAKRKRPDGATA